MKTCPKCKIDKNDLEFLNSKHKIISYCKICIVVKRKEWNGNNKEKSRLYRRAYNEKNPSYFKKRYEKSKDAFLTMYGNKCSCCGEVLKEFLSLDHIKGQVGIKKKELSLKAYRKAIKEYKPKEYRILCMNCNHSIGTKGYCPHQK